MREGSEAMRGSVEAAALALQGVLALEGRDVLSRVELAASELDRFALAPALAERIGAIREAVFELDTLLDKIERLAHPLRRAQESGQAGIRTVLTGLRERLAPALAARGVVLEPRGDGPAREVAVPAAVVERLLLLWLRTAIEALACDGSLEEESPIVLVVEGHDRGDAITLRLRPQTGLRRARFALERAAQVELDVALAEWQGRAVRGLEDDSEWLGLELPACGRSGDV